MTTRAEIEKILFDATLTPNQQINALVRLVFLAEDRGYDRAANDITLKLQELIPSSAKNVPDARVQGAWRDATNVAYNHIGKRR